MRFYNVYFFSLSEQRASLQAQKRNLKCSISIGKIRLYLGTDKAWSSWTRINGGSRKDFLLEASLNTVKRLFGYIVFRLILGYLNNLHQNC